MYVKNIICPGRFVNSLLCLFQLSAKPHDRISDLDFNSCSIPDDAKVGISTISAEIHYRSSVPPPPVPPPPPPAPGSYQEYNSLIQVINNVD
jgi:hypothetical protein